MTNRERENATLSFLRPKDRGAVEETFFPWMLSVERFAKEGLPVSIFENIYNSKAKFPELEKYFNIAWAEGVLDYEKHFGFDPVRRVGFTLPFRRFEEKTIEDNSEYTIKSDVTGRQIKHHKESGIEEEYKQVVTVEEDWERLKEHGNSELDKYFTKDNISKVYGQLKEGHARGDYSIRLNIEGFFWTPRELLGIEPHMYGFYDYPELIHNINEYMLKIYLEKLTMVLDVIPADVIYISEDLSGKNGPMISPEIFDEFIGSYYRRLIPVLKSKNVKHVFVDTDGDFRRLIPNFIAAGVEGFLPMDVNAGMDIVAVRKEFPNLKFIGGYNKLCIAEGRQAIDREFQRILPVIKQGGYIPGCDHQVAPSTSYEDYKYYISQLKRFSNESGTEK